MALRARHRRLAGGPPPRDVVLLGPRGNGKDATATDQDIDAAFTATGMDADGRLAAREELNKLGYIWCPPGQLPPVVWSAGIPSLIRYAQAQATPAAAVRA